MNGRENRKNERPLPPYAETGALPLFLRRIPWLLFLMLSATLTGTVISAFESAISTSVYLTAFIPMLMGTGGNAGSQASVAVIRALSLGELPRGALGFVVRKELRVSLLTAGALALVAFVKVLTLDPLLLGNLSYGDALRAAPVVSIALFLTVLLANAIGASLPILSRRLGLDPAVTAAPFITTAVDTVSLLVYFEVARVFIPGI